MEVLQSLLQDETLVWRGVGALAFLSFAPHDASGWRWFHFLLWAALMYGAIEVLGRLVLAGGRLARLDAPAVAIKASGKPLERLETLDLAFIVANKLITALFTYHMIRYSWLAVESGAVPVALQDATLLNTLGALAAFYVVYDFFYTLFHRALHHPSVYGYVHKHHHRQVVPFRGNMDAVNVHPFEFTTGEYLHLLAVYLVRAVMPVHVYAITTFIVLGGVLASLNHTRFDARFPLPGLDFVYQVRYHDIHHFFPPCNYGQYIMLWDWLLGTFRSPSDDTLVKPAADSASTVPAVSTSTEDEPTAPAAPAVSSPASSAGSRKRRTKADAEIAAKGPTAGSRSRGRSSSASRRADGAR